MAESQPGSGEWYRLRANHVPFRPAEINLDSQGQLWMTAVEEYDPAVWCLDTRTGKVNYISNSEKNNYLGSSYINFINKPQLQSEVVYAVKDSRGNSWYAVKDKGVWCEKPDGQWESYTRENTAGQLPSNDFQRIRQVEKSDGSTWVLLISYEGLAVIDSSYHLAEVRTMEASYNNYMFNDALVDSRGQYWIGRNNGVEKGDSLLNTANVSTLFPDNQPFPPLETPITGMMEDSRANLWFISGAYVSEGVYCYKANGEWAHYDLKSLLSARNQVICLAEDKFGSIWFGLNYGGLVRYTPNLSGTSGEWTVYSGSSLGLQSDDILSIASADQGIYFVTGYNPSVPGNGTGLHYLPLNQQGQPQTGQIISYDYRTNSTSLASNRIGGVTADRQGGVWFASYDRPSLSRLKADGSWQQFHSNQNGGILGEFGIVGVVADSQDNIFMAPQRQQPRAYNAAREEWVSLPACPSADIFFYGVYRDSGDGIWFYSSDGVFYLNPTHSEWRQFTQANSGLVSDYVDYGVLVDSQQRVWMQGRYGVSLLDRSNNKEQWKSFTNGDSSGFNSGYRIYEDDQGNIWNANQQRYNVQNGCWETSADTSAFDLRKLHFLNGDLAANMDISQALVPVNVLNEQLMTIDTRGRVYFAAGMAGLASVNAGVVVYQPGAQNQAGPALKLAEITAKGDLSLTFDQDMANPSGTHDQFVVEVDGTKVAVTAVENTNTPTKIKLVLQNKVTGAKKISIKYTRGEAANEQIKSLDGRIVDSFLETWEEWTAPGGKSGCEPWTIKFSLDVDPSSVIANNIYILDKTGTKLDASLSMPDSKTIVLTPKTPYTSGERYNLYISKSIRSAVGGTYLKDNIHMKFTAVPGT